jgi:hypothetical protein
VRETLGGDGVRAAGLPALAVADHFTGAVLAAATAGADGKFHLHIAQGARTLFDGATNLPISDAVTNADVHDAPLVLFDTDRLHANANDCQCDAP